MFDALTYLEGLLTESVPAPASAYTAESVPKRVELSPDDLPVEWRTWFEERAAIREYEGGQAREHAEAEALKEVIAAMNAARRESRP